MAGITAGSSFPDNTPFLLPLIFFVSFLTCLSLYSRKKVTFLFFLVLIFCWGYLSIQDKLSLDLPTDHISTILDTPKIKITGRVVSFKKHHEKKYTMIVMVHSFETKDNTSKNANGKILLNIYGPSKPAPEFGDRILFESSIKSIRNFMNPGAFDYKKFLKLKGIYGTAYTDSKRIKILKQTDQIGLFLKLIRKIENLRTCYYDFILIHGNGSKTSRILASLITGKKEAVSYDLQDLFSKTGISHLLAISGLHLSIVSLLFFIVFYRVLSFWPRLAISGLSKKIAGILSLVPLIAYAIFTGFSPSTQRALIMIVVLLFSFVSEREKDIVSSLSVAGILILTVDSAALFSISFQLSFMAVVFILGGLSVLKKYSLIQKNNMVTRMGLMCYVTLFASLGTFPLTAHYFNMVSFIALISNLLFIPVIGFVVLPLGLVSLVCFSCFPLVALCIIHVCNQILLVAVMVLEFIVRLPFAWSRITSLPWNEITLIYLVFLLIFSGLKKHKRSVVFLSSVIFVLGFSTFWVNQIQKRSDSNLTITILDVGQGSSAFVQTPEGENILVDGGGFSDISSFDTGRFILAPFLWQKGIRSLDYVILSHPESDHLNGLIFILDNFNVRMLIKNNDQKASQSYASLMKLCKTKRIQIIHPSDLDNQLHSGSVKLIFYMSPKGKHSAEFNDNSLVFKLVYDDFSMLFPGDILHHRETNLSITDDIDLNSDILLSPHHGSSTSSATVFLDKVNPRTVIISCGWQNRYGFPHDTVLKRYQKKGIHIFRTDKDGAVIISSDGKHYTTKTHMR